MSFIDQQVVPAHFLKDLGIFESKIERRNENLEFARSVTRVDLPMLKLKLANYLNGTRKIESKHAFTNINSQSLRYRGQQIEANPASCYRARLTSSPNDKYER